MFFSGLFLFRRNIKIILFLVSFISYPIISNAALTGVWGGLSGSGAGTATIASGADAALTITSANAVNANGGTFTTTASATILGIAAAYTSTDGNIVGDPALRYEHRWDANSPTDCDGTSTWTHTFARPVYDPVLHIDRIGGNLNEVGTANDDSTSSLTTITTVPAGGVVERLSGIGPRFEVSGNTVFRTPNIGPTDVTGGGNECTTTQAGATNHNTACGTVRINGLVSSVTLFMQAHPLLSPNSNCTTSDNNPSAGDAMELIWEVNQDLGDAPASYGDPVHAIRNSTSSGSLYLGSTVPDDEINSQHSAAAGDDGAEEDGVASFPIHTTDAPTYTVPVTLTNSTGASATVCGWIDFDLNNAFGDGTTEEECTTVANGATSTNLTFDVSSYDLLGGAADYYARFRICSTASECNSPTTAAADGEVEDYLLPVDTLPVTLSHFTSETLVDRIEVDWSTSSELFNVGFQLWGLDGSDSKWEKLHTWLVRSGSGNAVEPQSYSKQVRVPNSIDQLISLGISSVDSNGIEHYYGPFDVDTAYGNLSTLKPIAWNHIREQVDTQMASRGYTKDRNKGYRKISAPATAASTTISVIELDVREAGIYQIRAQALLDVGIDWRDVSKRDIALIDQHGNAVVRYVSALGAGSGLNRTLGQDGEIYFYASGVDEIAGLYTDMSIYRLIEDPYRALDGQYQGKQGVTTGFNTSYIETSRVETDTQYVLSSAADDPWVESVVLSYPNLTSSYGASIPVEADALWALPSVMTLELARSSELKAIDIDGDGEQDPEHMVDGVVLAPQGANGLLTLGTAQAVGRGQWNVDFEMPGNTPVTVLDGNAVVGGLFNAGSGYAFSEIHVDAASLSYARPTMAKAGDNYLTFTGSNDGESGYEVTVPDKGWPVVFAYNDQGALVRMALESQLRVTDSDGERQRIVKLALLNGAGTQASPIQYWVSGKRGFKQVASLSVKSITPKSTLLAQAAGSNYLLIAHPAFMGAALDSYANFKRNQGHYVAIIDYLEIVESFGGGQIGPHGLTTYLSEVELQSGFDHVLLVGGSTYDHTDIMGTGAVTFIPGHYGSSGYSNYTATDVPYISNVNNDLFSSIGRWPVRTVANLQTIIDKSIMFANTDHDTGSALLIAEQTIEGENIDFGKALTGVASNLPSEWTTTTVDVDTILSNNPDYNLTQAVAQAKTEIITELNNSPDVVLYNGHATTSQLSNKGLFKASDVGSVTTQNSAAWFPMSCYVTYYESTHVNTLAHQLLFNGNAVTISGAMLLSNQTENVAMGEAILTRMVTDNTPLGEAVNATKATKNNTQLTINWALLGDPTMRP